MKIPKFNDSLLAAFQNASGSEYANGYRWKPKHDIIVVPIDKKDQRYVLVLRERVRNGQTVVVAAMPMVELTAMKPEQVPTIEQVTRG